MRSPVTITAPTNNIRLDEQRRAEVAFTVYNSSGRALRARTRIVPLQPEAVPWLTLEGEAEHSFPIAGTYHYLVTIAVPSSAPAGSYSFRLDVIGEDNPDEDFTEGLTVTFEVPEPPKPFPWWIIAAVAAAVLVIAIVTFLVWPRSVAAPDVTGNAFAQAVSALEDSGLAVAGQTQQEARQY